jgi:two-component system, OmpR family, phosphate regulon sensor histidine kinase PhoR
MATARNQDVVGFTRIFVLFCVLVLTPALFMSGFGVVAIKDVRQAERERRREQSDDVLRAAETRVAAVLDATDKRLSQQLRTMPAGATLDPMVETLRQGADPIGAWLLFVTDGNVVAGEPLLQQPRSLAALRAACGQTPVEQTAHLALSVGVVALRQLSGSQCFAYLVDPDHLAKAIAGGVARGWTADLRWAAPGVEAPIVNALERLSLSADDGEVLRERRLDVPFDQFSLIVRAPPSAENTMMIIYIVLLSVFLITLATGVVVVARLVYMETKLSRLKTDFVSHVSHELRTPLTSIRMFIDTLRLGRTQSPAETQECLDLLAQETERLSGMIERVLGYARLRAGRRPFHLQAEAVDDIIGDALDAFRAQTLARSASIQLHVEVQPGLPAVLVDRAATVEALLNYLHNASKYGNSPHKASAEICVFAREGLRGRVVIGVKDNGPGLVASELRRVFDRYYQGGNLLSSRQPGSGLGLAITKAIVEGQGGTCAVLSEPGQGAEFSIEVRAAR